MKKFSLVRLQTLAVALFALALSACAQPPVPQDHYYRLNVSPPAKLEAPLLDGIVEVERFSADGLASGRPILYSTGGNEILEYHYHFWSESPTAMLQDRLVDYLRDGGIAKTVVTPEMRVEPDFVINGRVKRLERVPGSDPQVRIDLELALTKISTGNIVTLGSYRLEASHDEDSVAASIAAFDAIISEAYGRFINDVKGQ